ncbi:MAG TPA: phosphatase PAP2 family protein [Rudaea sp.]
MHRPVAVVLSILLASISPFAFADDPDPGYLFPGADLHIQTWLPPAPPRDSLQQAADVQTIFALRADVEGPRGVEAHQDDVYQPAEVAPRFDFILGIHLDPKTAPHTLQLLQRVTNDAEWLMRPIKRAVADGGRQRPFVDYPSLHTCAIAYERLPKTGSYPSGHASLGWLWGNILAELAPAHADALLARGIAFGDSRVVCGFHYPTDIAAGRLAASALLERLHADKRFQRDLDDARAEVAKLMRNANAANERR